MQPAQNKLTKNLTATALFLLALVLGLHFTRQANAQTTRGFVVSPPTIQFELEPGARAEKVIKVTNNSAEATEFVVNIQDFIVTDSKGTPELLPEGVLPDNKYAASTWATVLPDRFTIQPGQSKTTTLYLQVPGDARPGGKYVSVAFRPQTAGMPESSGAKINTVIGALVYLTVEGDITEKAQITQFSAPNFSEYGPIPFKTEVLNLGDLHINPKASVEVKDMLGRKVYSYALDNINIFPGTSRVYQNSWETKWLFGRFTASITGYYGQSNLPLTAIASFWVIPYKLITAILLAVAIVVTITFYLKKRNEPQEIVEG
jgi:hypothetical protein